MGPLSAALQRGLAVDWLLAPEDTSLVNELGLPEAGLCGQEPLAWWAAGAYDGGLRQHLLKRRRRADRREITSLISGLSQTLKLAWGRPGRTPLLVPIPGWKRDGNPLPALLSAALARRLGWRQEALLRRSRPVLGQHHLGRELRWANQAGSFLGTPSSEPRWGPPAAVLLVDDILTTGATALAAAEALQRAGWRTAGLACLARTPWQGRDLRFAGRSGDGPG